MKLDVNVFRYMSREEFRVLTSVEMGMKNHELVPASLIEHIAGLNRGGAYKILQVLLRNKLLHHEHRTYDGFRLTYMGYDFLALKALMSRGVISGIGRQIGVGKESDIFIATNDDGELFALKLHRLGRISFRRIKEKRDYLRHRKSASWIYLSRLAALKEFSFMKALYENGFPVPEPMDTSRHAIVMRLVQGYPFGQIERLRHPAAVYQTLMATIVRLAKCGLIHGDFNEFNLMIDDEENVTLIDFPQMISTSHANAKEQFERDVNCIVAYFLRKFDYRSPHRKPDFATAVEADGRSDMKRLDVEVAASGFSNELALQFENLSKMQVKKIEDMPSDVDVSDDEGSVFSTDSECDADDRLHGEEGGSGSEAAGEGGSDKDKDDDAPTLVPASGDGGAGGYGLVTVKSAAIAEDDSGSDAELRQRAEAAHSHTCSSDGGDRDGATSDEDALSADEEADNAAGRKEHGASGIRWKDDGDEDNMRKRTWRHSSARRKPMSEAEIADRVKQSLAKSDARSARQHASRNAQVLKGRKGRQRNKGAGKRVALESGW